MTYKETASQIAVKVAISIMLRAFLFLIEKTIEKMKYEAIPNKV